MFSVLPGDISLYILSFLPVQDVCNLYLLSHHAKEFLISIEDALYHQHSVSHRFVSPGTSLESASLPGNVSSKVGEKARSWKELYKQHLLLQRNWAGRGTVREGTCCYPVVDDMQVQSFTVDDEGRTVIVVNAMGELNVYAMEDYQHLWTLGIQVRLTHPVWSAGFLVFSGMDSIQVWRRCTDAQDAQYPLVNGNPINTPLKVPSPLAATQSQFERAPILEPASVPSELRGHYTPHAYIRSPYTSRVRMVRFHFPVIAMVVHSDPYAVYCYDIAEGIQLPTLRLSDIREVGSHSTPGFTILNSPVLLDIQVSEERIILCFDSIIIVAALRSSESEKLTITAIFERDAPPLLKELALQLKTSDCSEKRSRGESQQMSLPTLEVPTKAAMQLLRVAEPDPKALTDANHALVPHGVTALPSACFISAQVSPNGRHLVSVSGFGLLCLYPDFNRISRHLVTAEEIVQRLHLKEPLSSVTWSNESRRLVVRSSFGKTFLIELNPKYHFPFSPHTKEEDNVSLRNVRIHRLLHFEMPHQVDACPVITGSRIWLRWDPSELRKRITDKDDSFIRLPIGDEDTVGHIGVNFPEIYVCYIDFMAKLNDG